MSSAGTEGSQRLSRDEVTEHLSALQVALTSADVPRGGSVCVCVCVLPRITSVLFSRCSKAYLSVASCRRAGGIEPCIDEVGDSLCLFCFSHSLSGLVYFPRSIL